LLARPPRGLLPSRSCSTDCTAAASARLGSSSARGGTWASQGNMRCLLGLKTAGRQAAVAGGMAAFFE
jgi:hypothetical protein